MIRPLRWIVLSHLFLLLRTNALLHDSPLGVNVDTDAFNSPPNAYARPDSKYHHFHHPIKRVAVIGAGSAGLIAASALLDEGLEVRLFERRLAPGGNWYHSDTKPIPYNYSNPPLEVLAFTPDIPSILPFKRVYEDGDDEVGNEWRLREHESPSPIWDSLTSNVPPFEMPMPNINYPKDVVWNHHHMVLQRYIRQYAASVGLNPNDDDRGNVTSYSTRVERVRKLPSSQSWELTLRRITRAPYSDKLLAEWWTEEFDAVVVACREFESPWVPAIKGLKEWTDRFPESIIHSREYRNPRDVAGRKNVLIVGAFLSSTGIAVDLLPHVNVSASVRTPSEKISNPIRRNLLLHGFPANVTLVPEVVEFLTPSSTQLKDGRMRYSNGTIVSGFDYIIFSTGYRRSHPFLPQFHNNTIKGYETPETEVAPIVTDGTHMRSLHWTGHYISDPTIALTSLASFPIGTLQSQAIARAWSGRAQLPSIERMWATYPGPGKELEAPHGAEELYQRLFIQWLNEEALENGGRLISPLPHILKYRQHLEYFSQIAWYFTYQNATTFTDLEENSPRSTWPSRSRGEFDDDLLSSLVSGSARDGEESVQEPLHWAELQDRW